MSDEDPPQPLPPGQRYSEVLKPVHYGKVPRIDLDRWTLRIGGETTDGGMTVLDWERFTALPRIEVTADLHCVARFSTLGLRWAGVPARVLLELAPPDPGAEFAELSAAYGYSASVRVEDLRHPQALFATHLGGEPLTPEHGWPVRAVLPHLYAWKGPKWVAAMDYHHAPERGMWERNGYHLVGEVWREERYSHQE